MLGRTGNAMGAFLLRDMLVSLRSPRLIAASVILGVILLASAWLLGLVASGASAEGAGERPLWERGSDGALTTLAFVVVPIVLPILPVALVTRNLQRDLTHGDFDLTLSKPVPGAGVALSKAAAIFVAVAIPIVPLSLASAVLIQSVTQGPINGGLLLGFVASNLILAALYLLLALPVGGFLTPRNLPVAALLAWFVFHLLQPTAFLVLGQLTGFIQSDIAPTFEPMATDAATFTGLHQALLAPYVPATLGFVTLPASLTAILLQWAPLVWAIALLVLYSIFLSRVPNR